MSVNKKTNIQSNFNLQTDILDIKIDKKTYLITLINIIKYYISLNKVSVSSIKFLDKLICNKDLYVKKYKDNNFYKNLIISNRKIIITLFIFNDLFICYFNDEKYIFNNSDINISVQYHNILNYIITYYDDKKDLLKTKRKQNKKDKLNSDEDEKIKNCCLCSNSDNDLNIVCCNCLKTNKINNDNVSDDDDNTGFNNLYK